MTILMLGTMSPANSNSRVKNDSSVTSNLVHTVQWRFSRMEQWLPVNEHRMTILVQGTMAPTNDDSHATSNSRAQNASPANSSFHSERLFSRFLNDGSYKRRWLLQTAILMWRTILLQLAILTHTMTILALGTTAPANDDSRATSDVSFSLCECGQKVWNFANKKTRI